MGIFDKIRPFAMNSDELSRLILETFGGGQTSSGVSVSSETAMRQMTVYACVKVLSQSIAQLPCHFMQQNGVVKEKALNHPLYHILHDQPNSWMTAAEFWGMATAHIALRGNFYAFKVMSPRGELLELLPIAPGIITNVEQKADYSIIYTASLSDGSQKQYSNKQIMHLRGLVMNGYMGLNPIEYARESVGLGLASEKFLARYFGKGMHPGAIIEHPLPLSAASHANLKKVLKEKYAGLNESQDLMLIDEGMKISFPPIKLVDAQFLELGRFTQSQICGLFRVPLMLIQSDTNTTTFASAEQFILSFVTHALTPIVVNIEQAIKRDLLSDEEKKTYYPKFSMTGLLRGDSAARAAFYRELINAEVINPNEARDLEEMNPYPGGEVYRTRTSSMKQSDTTPADPEKGAAK